jgi:hypothetical protein
MSIFPYKGYASNRGSGMDQRSGRTILHSISNNSLNPYSNGIYSIEDEDMLRSPQLTQQQWLPPERITANDQ